MGQTETTHNRRARNQKAFNEVLEEYESMKYCSSINAIDTSNECRATSNPAKPTRSDFVCDVENAILSVVKKRELLEKIINTYIMGNEELTKSRKHNLEQRIGMIFTARKIWPVYQYFSTKRKGK